MRSLRTLLKLAGIMLAVGLTALPSLKAQVVSSGLTGLVRDTDAGPVAGAKVTAVHEPTGATFNATTSSAGRYNFRGLPVGGPYTITVVGEGYTEVKRTDVQTALGVDIDISFELESGSGDMIELSELQIRADSNSLDPSAIGSGMVLSSAQLSVKPTSERSLADMISATPLVALRSTFGDREESQITAVGQNNRYNSIMIDGARINDQFGLNGTGLASFFNPLSLDTIEQLSVQISPYDVRMAGATGAYINAVTKSGTNRFKGSAYYLFQGDSLLGQRLRGYNARDEFLTGARNFPKLERETMGFTLGGPIIKNRLFFFGAYEKFESVSAGRDPRFSTPQESAILTQLAALSGAAGRVIDWGDPVTDATTNNMDDEKIIGKIDWNILEGHRLSVRYSKTEGQVPQFGNFANATATLNDVTGGVTTSPNGHFYSQERVEESYAAQLFSQWSPDFKTEIKFSQNTQDQLTPLNTVAPMILITGLTGTNLLNNTAVTTGAYWAGTEQFRQGNQIKVESKQFSASGDYFLGGIVLTGGFEREESEFYNIFRQGSYGLIAYRNYADFIADTNAVIQRNYYDPNLRDPADLSDFASNGIYLQSKWDPLERLTVTAGLRYEVAEMDKVPMFNQALFDATGFRNDGTLDGSDTISPRIGFNYAIDNDRVMQIRGGVGHFSGRAPWVFFSNSFNALGVGDFTRSSSDTTNPLPDSLEDYLRDHFDPESPTGTGTDNPSLRRAVNWIDAGLDLPSVWRANLAFERKLGFLNSTLTAEVVVTEVDSALFITNENLRLRDDLPSADGRWRFGGNPASNTTNPLYPGFTDLYRISNSDVGGSTYWTLTWDRPMTKDWAFTASYTKGRSTEAQAIGQTTASGQWQRNVVFNQGEVSEATSDFEIKDRIQISLSKRFEFRKDWTTTASLYYEGRTGNPYSWVYTTDLNGDGRNDNDIFVVPSGADDARFDFSLLNQTQVNSYFALLDQVGLSRYAGKVTPRNGFTESWVNRLDLRIEQVIPIREPFRLKLFMDFVNFGAFFSRSTFGYVETSPAISNDVFRRNLMAGARYGADGRIQPSVYTATYRNPATGATRTDPQYGATPAAPNATFTQLVSVANSTPSSFGIDNGMSRWRIQVGARIEF